MIFELCAENYDAVVEAENHGIKRIELCSALTVGGLTPSLALINRCTKSKLVEIHVMMRLREGNFHYTGTEIAIMRKDIISAKKAGAKGVVFGCLDANNNIDIKACSKLAELAIDLDLEITFHRAFDFCKDPIQAMEILIDLGFDRILSSGQQNKVVDGLDLIKTLVEKSAGRIQIMAGSGVSPKNAIKIAETGVDALHFTSYNHAPIKNPGMGSSRTINSDKIASIVNLFKS